MKSVNIKIPSLSQNIRIVESFIANAQEEFHLNEDLYGNIMISVTEAVNNAIKHGNQNISKKTVSLLLTIEDSLVRFVVEDEGDGFDYRNIPDPTARENLRNPTGRGIFLMKRLCDEVKFTEGGKTVELVFYINP